MEDSHKKQELDPIRTLRLNLKANKSSDTSSPEAFNTTRTFNSRNINCTDTNDPFNSGSLAKVLHRAKFSKRDSLMTGVLPQFDDNQSYSSRCESHQGKNDNDSRRHIDSPKKSIFGQHIKFPQPFEERMDNSISDDADLWEDKRKNTFYCDDILRRDSAILPQSAIDIPKEFPLNVRHSIFGDESLRKRNYSEYFNENQLKIEPSEIIFKDLQTKQRKVSNQKPKGKKSIKTSKSKKNMTNKSLSSNSEKLEKIFENSEEEPQRKTSQSKW